MRVEEGVEEKIAEENKGESVDRKNKKREERKAERVEEGQRKD